MMRQSRPAQSRPLASHAPMSSVTRASGSVVQPFVSIVVPCRNEAEYIGPMLDSMLANAYPGDRLEVLIVDRMSGDGTRPVSTDYASRSPMRHLLGNPGRTTPQRLNWRIARTQARVSRRQR